MQYRAEIDGLRALAVMPVILFHAGFELFSGGFVGVDVFFVISGYLITTIIISDLHLGAFSLVNFYERRARRILPALFFVLIVCLPIAWFYLLPNDLREFSKHLASIPLFSSNFIFWREAGYFSTLSELKPLLHTWSLAVEEQFYILFPLFLMFFWRHGKSLILPLLIIIFLFSLLIAQWASIAKPAAAFYLLPTRGWELIVGALSALLIANNNLKHSSRALNEIFGWLGLVLILFSILVYDQATPFPGLYALAPTVGTALIILFVNQETSIGKLIGGKLLVGIGLISYSAYLWHQPLLAFYKYRFFDSISDIFLILVCLLSFGFAYISWKYIEAPFRNRSLISQRSIFLSSIVSGLIIICIGLSGYFSNGFLHLTKWDNIRDAQMVENQRGAGFQFCKKNKENVNFTNLPTCLIGDPLAKPEGILWGDSFGGAILIGLNEILKSQKKSYYAVINDGCISIAGASRINSEYSCTPEYNNTFFEEFLSQDDLKKLIWISNFGGTTGPESDPLYLLDLAPASGDDFRRRVLRMSERLDDAKKDVVFVSDTPFFPIPVAKTVSRSYFAPNNLEPIITPQNTEFLRMSSGLSKNFLQVLQDNIKVVDGLDIFCMENSCSAFSPGFKLLYKDQNHISDYAAEILAIEILDKFD